jgi:mannose-1-phosphate guanylyltransferase/phosphomannomutase
LGVRLDVGGERIFLVNEAGQRVPEMEACAAMAQLALQATPGGTIIVPVNLPDVFERIAGQHGGQVIRCKVDPHDLMEAAAGDGVVLAGDGAGSFVFPQFQPTVDGLMAIARLLEFLATQELSLSQVVSGLPPYYLQRRSVSCPWEAKGTVMRLLNQQYKDQRTELIDGIKVRLREDEWVLVLPDPDQPLFHIFAESTSEADAAALADKYQRIIEGLRD